MKRPVSIFFIGFIAFVATATAQDKPSFAGTWKLASDASADMFVPSQMVVTQDTKTLTVTTTSQMGEFKTTYNLDGTEGKSPIDMQGITIDRATKAAWDGTKLVLTVASNFNGQAFETKAIWSISADGALLVEATRPDFQGGPPVTSKLTYKKG